MKGRHGKLLPIIQNRLFLIFVGISILFCVIIGKFYQLQIIDYDEYESGLRASVERQIEIPAPRGLIFDRYGRPLAINQPTNVVKFDQQVKITTDELNQVMLDVANLLEKNGDVYVDNIPISKTAPFEYTGSKTAINQFMYSVPYDNEVHRQELLLLSAEEIIDYLRSDDVFNIDASISDTDARKIIALRTEVYGYAYRKYNLVTLASDISQNTVAQLEEYHMEYPGVMVDVEPIRYYPHGESMGSILGYTRAITEAQYEEMKTLGYEKTDIVGHDGVEKTMEAELRGQKGLERVEVDNMGRRVHTIEQDDAVPGNDIFLTIDLDLQQAAYDSVERRLSEAVVERLRGGRSSSVKPLTSKEVIVSMIESSQLSLSQMKEGAQDSIQKELYERLILKYNELDEMVKQNMTPIDFLVQLVEEGTEDFTEKEILLAFDEQGKVKLTEETRQQFRENREGSTEYTIIEQLEKGTLKPNQFAVNPSSASTVVIDVDTGELLSMVGYPYADSNQMTTNFNQYYGTLFDERSMLWNRALMTAKAPGSTFKMISAIAGLEEGVVTPSTQIYCTGVYEKVGQPAPKCWIHSNTGGGHGNVDLETALEVSCNYYFFEVAYRLSQQSDTLYGGIDALTKYVEMFGLDSKTGVELAETLPNMSTPSNLIKNQLTSVFGRIKNMTPETQENYVEQTIQILENSMYPFANSQAKDLEGQIDYLIQYELKRNIEPVLGDVFIGELDEILDSAYLKVQEVLQLHLTDIVEKIRVETLENPQQISLKSKTKEQLVAILDQAIGKTMNERIEAVIDDIEVYDLLDSYEYAYSIMYNRELRKDPNSDIVEALRLRLETIEDDEDYYRQYVADKVRDNIIQAIASHLLEGLELEWQDGTTVRTAIGQGQNAFTPLQIARYIAALANGERVYEARIINGLFDAKGSEMYEPKESVVYNLLDIRQQTLDIIHEGMYLVSNGSAGSSRTTFRDFDVKVATKTGTAQEGTNQEHSWLVGFAPYDDPEIAFVTTIYHANGQGNYGQLMARDILTEYFDLEKKPEKTTLEHTFVE